MGLFSKKAKTTAPPAAMTARQEPTHHWGLFEEGQLLVDMFETDGAIVVRSFVAGVEPEHIELSMHNDMLTIRGTRTDIEEIHDDRFFHRECHWGTFSRSVIIPKAVDAGRIRALFKHGVVTVILPKFETADSSFIIANAKDQTAP